MTRDEYKNEILNVSVMFAAYLRKAMVSGWNPEGLKAYTDSKTVELAEITQKAMEDDELDRLDYVVVSEWTYNMEAALDKATEGICEFLEVTDELF